MHLKLIACNIFQREACHCAARSPHVIDFKFIELGEHVHPEKLRKTLQAAIDAAESSTHSYDAILLLFGLCGNAGVGLQTRSTPLVIPRAHDCCTVLLGSRKRFKEHFGDAPSTPFSSSGYMERGDYFLRIEDGESKVYYGDVYAKYVEKYGEENARYIWEQMHPARHDDNHHAVFIDVPEFAHLGYAEQFRLNAEAEAWDFVRVEGSLRLIWGLISGEWSEEDFLTVQPGQRTQGVYDWNEIIRAE